MKSNQRSYYNLRNSGFWGGLSMESPPQNPEFRINPEISPMHFKPANLLHRISVVL